MLPALALAAVVGVPQAGAFVLGLRRHRRAADAGILVGAALAAWVTLQLPLVGWTSQVQWTFVAVGVAEVATATLWRRHAGRTQGASRPALPGERCSSRRGDALAR